MRRISELIADLQRLDPDTWTEIEWVDSEVRTGFGCMGGRRTLVMEETKPEQPIYSRFKPTRQPDPSND